jgi:hypothetical protein
MLVKLGGRKSLVHKIACQLPHRIVLYVQGYVVIAHAHVAASCEQQRMALCSVAVEGSAFVTATAVAYGFTSGTMFTGSAVEHTGAREKETRRLTGALVAMHSA